MGRVPQTWAGGSDLDGDSDLGWGLDLGWELWTWAGGSDLGGDSDLGWGPLAWWHQGHQAGGGKGAVLQEKFPLGAGRGGGATTGLWDPDSQVGSFWESANLGPGCRVGSERLGSPGREHSGAQARAQPCPRPTGRPGASWAFRFVKLAAFPGRGLGPSACCHL